MTFVDRVDGQPLVQLHRVGSGTYRLLAPFRFQDRDVGTITVPRDIETFTTNLASIPWYTSWFVPVFGEHMPASVLHDALVGDLEEPDYVLRNGGVISRHEADQVMLRAMRSEGTPCVRRSIIWSAVSIATASALSLRTRLWLLILLVGSIVHLLDIIDLIDVAPHLGSWSAPIEWLVAIVATWVVMASLAVLLVPWRQLSAALVQSLVFGVVFLPVLVCLPARVVLVCLPARSIRACL